MAGPPLLGEGMGRWCWVGDAMTALISSGAGSPSADPVAGGSPSVLPEAN